MAGEPDGTGAEWVTAAATSSRDPVAIAAIEARRLLASGALKEVWRYAIVQLLDEYTSARRHRGPAAAQAMWDHEPERTGDARVDAAFAAMAEHLAHRDGWNPPAWSQDPSRTSAHRWIVTDLVGMHPTALAESPPSFAKRGVFITRGALERA